jgi:serine phosphatase RsbU (regulator of sigma subunit)
MDLALCLFDFEKKHLQYAGANNPLYQIRNGELTVFNANKMPIGIHKNAEVPFANNEIEALPNDLYYIFSDGYIDQFGGETGLKYFSKNFKELLISINDKPMETQREILEKTHIEFKGKGKQTDDMLVIGIRF